MREVTIIADDLTGAADTGIAFAVAGLPTYVSFEGTSPADVPIVSVDTDSRSLPQATAGDRVYAAARAAYRDGSRTLYKKIDSTLRGNVGAEIAAAFRAARETFGEAVALVAPAFPGTGRTTRAGRVLVAGVPLEETEIWQKSGMQGAADLCAMLSAAGLTTATARPREPVPSGADAVICDAASEEDLAGIARTGAALRVPVVWVGSGGLAHHLPAALGLRRPSSRTRPEREARRGPVLIVVGSRSSVARDQAARLARDDGVRAFELSAEMLATGDTHAGWPQVSGEVARTLERGSDVVLTIELGDAVDLSRAPLLAAAIGRFAAQQAPRLGGLIATGGDIARAALNAIGAGGMYLAGEVEPGVPLGVVDTDPPLRVVTKAGAFGNEDTLRRARAALQT